MKEAQASGDYVKAMKRLAQRRSSIRNAEPFLVAVAAEGNDFIYTDGMLCYTMGCEVLRLLDVHRSATEELVVDIVHLLENVVGGFHADRPFDFRPVHCSNGVLSCVCKFEVDGRLRHYIVVLGTDGRLITCHSVLSSRNIFVRNDRDYLIFGSESAILQDGSICWAIWRLDLANGNLDDPLVLNDVVGSFIGHNVCFEIFDGYFYSLSTKYTRHPRYGRWNSFYQASRFPLKVATLDSIEWPLKGHLWRRNVEKEGHEDERWGKLQLEKDETTGELLIVECRREWPLDNPKSQRTCYKKVLCFTNSITSTTSTDDNNGNGNNNDDEDDDNNDDNDDSDETLSMVRAQEKRAPEDIHMGDNGTNGSMLMLQDCFVRFYHVFAQSFVDIELIDDCIRLRVRPKPAGKAESKSRAKDSCKQPDVYVYDLGPAYFKDSLIYNRENAVTPDSRFDRVEYAVDDRSIIYAPPPERKGTLRSLVLISFDASIHLLRHGKRRPESDSSKSEADVASGIDAASSSSLLQSPIEPHELWCSMQEATYMTELRRTSHHTPWTSTCPGEAGSAFPDAGPTAQLL